MCPDDSNRPERSHASGVSERTDPASGLSDGDPVVTHNPDESNDASELMQQIYRAEKESLNELKDKLANELKMKPGSIANWGTGNREVPDEKADDLIAALRGFRWKVDPIWKLATALSELLGANSDDFHLADRFLRGNDSRRFKHLRKDGAERIIEGIVSISRPSDRPRWWKYDAQTVDIETGDYREFEGPVVIVDKLVCAICVGGLFGTAVHFRFDAVYPSSSPERNISFGLMISTATRHGGPQSAPFALIPEEL